MKIPMQTPACLAFLLVLAACTPASGDEADQEADRFARSVSDAIGVIEEEYVRGVNVPELTRWAIEGLYRAADELIPPTLRSRLKDGERMRPEERLALLCLARARLGQRKNLADGGDTRVVLNSLLARLDRHGGFDDEPIHCLITNTGGSWSTVGLKLRKDPATGLPQVVKPLRGGSAHRGGVRAGDLILSVIQPADKPLNDRDPPQILSTEGLPLAAVERALMGRADSTVALTLRRVGREDSLEVQLVRGWVNEETVFGVRQKKDTDWDYLLDPDRRIGYVRVSQFGRDTARDLKAVVDDLVKGGLKGLVLDLRFNEGGLLTAAREVAGLFIDGGLVTAIRPRAGKEFRISAEAKGAHLDFPMVVLVNGETTSAAEIVAACLQDHGRAVVVGERSHGKGSVQNIIDIKGGGRLKLTSALFWRPNGQCLDWDGRDTTTGWGVSPNRGYALTLGWAERQDLRELFEQLAIIRPEGEVFRLKNPNFKDRQLALAVRYLLEQQKLAKGGGPVARRAPRREEADWESLLPSAR